MGVGVIDAKVIGNCNVLNCFRLPKVRMGSTLVSSFCFLPRFFFSSPVFPPFSSPFVPFVHFFLFSVVFCLRRVGGVEA